MSTITTNRRYRLRARPTGRVSRADLELVEEHIPALESGEALLRTLYLSVDPTSRVWMRETPTYVEPVPLGGVMRGVGIGQVVASRRSDMAVGDLVHGYTGWQEYAIASGSGVSSPWTVLPSPLPAPVPTFLGTLGHTGISAYIGMNLFGKPQPGETVVVSAAAGATGGIAGQLAQARGARVVGIAGGAAKAHHVVETLGFDACVDYQAVDWRERLAASTPDGIDVVFENVGGQIMDESVARTNRGARVVICGLISQYNELPAEGAGDRRTIFNLLTRRATLHTFLMPDYRDRSAEAIKYLANLLNEGKLRHEETIIDGLENAITALNDLFAGRNIGKVLVKVADPQPAVG